MATTAYTPEQIEAIRNALETYPAEVARIMGGLEHELLKPEPEDHYDDWRNPPNRILAHRAYRFAVASLQLIPLRMASPTATLVRSLVETVIVWRWILQSEDNAHEWWLKGDAQTKYNYKMLADAHRAAGIEVPTHVEREAKRDLSEKLFRKFPDRFPKGWKGAQELHQNQLSNSFGFKDLSPAGSVASLWQSVYPKLSAHAHPSASEALSGSLRGDDYILDQEGDLMLPIMALLNASVDACRLYPSWRDRREVAPPVPLYGSKG